MLRMTPTRGGWIEVIVGSMMSGKSEELLRRLRREQIAGTPFLLVKPGVDNRWGKPSEVISRCGSSMEAVPVGSSAEIVPLAADARVIGIDEAQFFDDGIVAVCEQLATEGKRVIVAGLDTTFRHEGFGPIPELLARAEFVDKVQAVCHACGAAAAFTQRLVNGAPAPFTGETVLVGDSESYEARCRSCFEAA